MQGEATNAPAAIVPAADGRLGIGVSLTRTWFSQLQGSQFDPDPWCFTFSPAPWVYHKMLWFPPMFLAVSAVVCRQVAKESNVGEYYMTSEAINRGKGKGLGLLYWGLSRIRWAEWPSPVQF